MQELPLVRRVNLQADGPSLYAAVKHLPYSFFLDTGMKVPGLGRHSLIGFSPFMVLEAKDGTVQLSKNGETEEKQCCPLEELERHMAEYTLRDVETGFPFNGGVVGYFSYDLGRYLERIPNRSVDDLRTPDYSLGFYDVVVIIDHGKGSVHLVSTGLPAKGSAAQKRARERMDEVEQLLWNPPPDGEPFATAGKLETHFSEAEYIRAMQKVIDYIFAGDIFQTNLSQRFSLSFSGDPWFLYCRLRAINPAPFAAYLNFGPFKIISASPERFLQVSEGRVETRPIKGTRPRGSSRVEDNNLREELWQSEKDRAELMMIVDLERNDLGRVCRVGSVRVPEPVRLEKYATVFHLVSTVEGELDTGKSCLDLLRASFPGGSITGAPKIRAMEIIEELEPVRRGIYTGSVGYLGFDGCADLNIVIRTIVTTGDKLYFQVGGGITADSDPAAEYRETLDKARALIRALGLE